MRKSRVHPTPGRRACVCEEQTPFNHCCQDGKRMEASYIPLFLMDVMLVAIITEMVAQENGDRLSADDFTS